MKRYIRSDYYREPIDEPTDLRHYVVRDASTGIPISYQKYGTYEEAAERKVREIRELRRLGHDVDGRDFEVYDVFSQEVIHQ